MKLTFIKKYVSAIVILLTSFANCPAAKCTWLKDDGKLRPFYTVNWHTNEPLQWYEFDLYNVPFEAMRADLYSLGRTPKKQEKAPLVNELVKICKDGWWNAGISVKRDDYGNIVNDILSNNGGQLEEWDDVPMLVKFNENDSFSDIEDNYTYNETIEKLNKVKACYINLSYDEDKIPWKNSACEIN